MMFRSILLASFVLAISFAAAADEQQPVNRTLVWPDGTRYVGGVLNGERSGKGTIFWQDGTRFVGQFKNDKRNGPGTMILPDGTVFTGFFKDDVLVDTRETLSAANQPLSTTEELPPVNQTAAPVPPPEPAPDPIPEPSETVAVTPAPAPSPMMGPAPEPEPPPMPEAPEPIVQPDAPVTAITPAIEQVLATTVIAWANAWSDQDVDRYLDSYSTDFETPRRGPRDAWENNRRIRLTRPNYIQVEVTFEQFELIAPDVADVQFEQRFESNTYRDTSTKVLRLQREPDGWKIVRERSFDIQNQD